MSYDKKRTINGFKKIIDQRSLDSMNSSLYSFLTLYCDFIAHYNIHGFRDYYSGRNFLEFLIHFTKPPFYLLINNKYGDWVQEMIAYAKEKESQIKFEFDNKVINKKLKILQQLADELGYEVIPKQSALPPTVEENGQFTLF